MFRDWASFWTERELSDDRAIDWGTSHRKSSWDTEARKSICCDLLMTLQEITSLSKNPTHLILTASEQKSIRNLQT